MSEPWFHVAALPDAVSRGGDTEVELDPEETRHAAGSRRLSVGARVVLFDGAGRTAPAELSALDRRRARARIFAVAVHAPPTPAVHLASALPKGDRQAVLLGMTAQLGLCSFTPLACARSVAKATPGSADRWQRVLREACKQSRNAHVPALEPPAAPAAFVERWAPTMPVWLLHPVDDDVAEPLPLGTAPAAALLVGPEGGFDDDEIAACERAGARCVALGDPRLRTETAAVAGVTLLRHGGKIAAPH